MTPDEILANALEILSYSDPETRDAFGVELSETLEDRKFQAPGPPIATRRYFDWGMHSYAQDDLNALAKEVIQFVSDIREYHEDYPDKIAITEMKTEFREPDHEHREYLAVPSVITYHVARFRERYWVKNPYYYLIKVRFSSFAHRITMEAYRVQRTV